METPVLVLVDLQNDFLASPRLEPHPATIVAGAAELLQAFRCRGFPVLHVRMRTARDGSGRMPHWERQGVRMCEEGSAGYAAPDELRPVEGEPVFHKTAFSAFTAPGFETCLRDLHPSMLVVAGLYSQTCLRQTALDAYQLGFNVRVARDGSGSHDPLHGAITLDYLSDRGIAVMDSRSILDSLDRAPEQFPWPAQKSNLDAKAAVETARLAQRVWSQEPMKERVRKLLVLAERLAHEKENLARLIVDEVRKPITYARGEVDRAVALLRAVAERAQLFCAVRFEAEGQVRYHPRGTVAMITPWNNPLAIPMGKLAPALAYGNAVIWKPSPRAPRIAQALMPLLAHAGFADGLVSIVEGDEQGARQIIASGVDAVAFSGSSRTGWSIIAQASARLLPVQAELGGNNGAIVAENGDVNAAADAIAEGAFGFAGQRCTSNRRAIVVAGVYDDFLRALEKSIRALPCGDPLQAETRVPQMISPEAAQAAAHLVARSRRAGLTVMQPGPSPFGLSDVERQSFHPPTVVLCDDPGNFIVQEESFGPILVIQKARHLEHALELLNGVPHGLVAALFSHDEKAQAIFLREAQAGLLKLNASTVNAGVDLPFTGWKDSGYGASEHGEANADFFTRRQAIYGLKH